jgi:hypothetical protein
MVGLEKQNGVNHADNNNSLKRNYKAIAASSAVSTAAILASLPISKIFPKYSKSLTKDEVVIVNNAADKVLNECTNLAKNGVKICDIKNVEQLTNLPKSIELLFNKDLQVSEGKNAFFSLKTKIGGDGKSIFINRDKLALQSFHEMGHAFNAYNSSFWSAMQKIRLPLARIIAPLIASLPIFTKKAEAKDGEELTAAQKFNNGLRKASPILAFAAMIPELAEEAKATQRGNAWAKKLLNSKLASKVCKSNAIAYFSYVLGAIGISASALVAMKIKDAK